MARRIERVDEAIKQELAGVIERELKDPRITDALVSITNVKTTRDMKYAKVYVSVLGDEQKRAAALEGLKNAKGFLRKKVALALTARTTPEFIFFIDDSVDQYMHIEKILKELNNGQ
jgi:ribosome-binding factor A